MAGRINEVDIERVRDASRIDTVIGEYVTLKPAGSGALKGLCPFHDEKTPSFTVRPAQGRYHCFGCQQGGDVFRFLMELEHLTFVEAVQRLAEKAGVAITMSDAGSSVAVDRGSRQRLFAANRAAAEFYQAQLSTPGAAAAVQYLAERGFDVETAIGFGCGYAPDGWDQLTKHLLGQGFTVTELEKAGLVRRGSNGPIDFFRRRLTWALKEATGEVVGFGARRLYADDRFEAKYLNTAETVLYRKSSLLYGLDLAKKEIARHRRVVVVEGYTDVMAMHVAGVTTAVASCGTAFGEEHISVLRRYLLDSEASLRGEVIYTFDGDSAGQKAALKAFNSDQRFAANTFVSIAPDGMDPCELRQAKGDAALRDLVARRKPLFEFAISETLKNYDLESAEGRVAAAAETIPMVARIKQAFLREDYIRVLAGMLGSEPEAIAGRVRRTVAAQAGSGAGPGRRDGHRNHPPADSAPAEPPSGPAGSEQVLPRARDPRLMAERESLKLVLQQPRLMVVGYRQVERSWYSDEAYGRVHDAIDKLGGPAAVLSSSVSNWIDAVAGELPEGPLRGLVSELAVEQLSFRSGDEVGYAGAMLASLGERAQSVRESELRSALRRAESTGDAERSHELLLELQDVSEYRRKLRERAAGGTG